MGDFSDDVGFEDPTMTVKRGTTKVMPQKQQDENLEDEEQEMSPEEKEELAHLPKGYIYNNCDSFQLAGRISSENIFLSIVSSSNGCAYRIQILPERGTKLIQSVHLRSIVFVTSDTPRECKLWIEGESKPRIALSLRPEIKVDPNKKSIVDKFLSTILTQNYRDNPLMPFRILWNQATIQEELRLLVERRSFKNENDPYPLSIAVPSTERANTLKINYNFMDWDPSKSYIKSYKSLCDYYDVQPNDDFIRIVSYVCFSKNKKTLDLTDFKTENPKEYYPLIRALEFNSWFDTLCLADLKIDPTMGKCIFKVINYNRTMSKIAIKKSKVYKTFMLDLVNALITNDQTRIRSVEVNKVNFTDADGRAFIKLMQQSKKGITSLRLPFTYLSTKVTTELFTVMASSSNEDENLKIESPSEWVDIAATLTYLDLACSSFNELGLSKLLEFIQHENRLTGLNVAYCDIDGLGDFIGALSTCCYKNLQSIDVEGNLFGNSGGCFETTNIELQPLFGQFFAKASKLKFVNLSKTKIPEQYLEMLFESLASNKRLHGMRLGLCSNKFNLKCSALFERFLPEILNVSALDLTGNYFDGDPGLIRLFNGLMGHPEIELLILNDVFKKSKLHKHSFKQPPKANLPNFLALLTIPKLYILSLSDNELRGSLVYLLEVISTLPLPKSSREEDELVPSCDLKKLVLSGNGLGDIGAIWVAEMLKKNKCLKEIVMNNNGIKILGWTAINDAVKENTTLVQFRLPEAEFAKLRSRDQVYAAKIIQDVRKHLHRNETGGQEKKKSRFVANADAPPRREPAPKPVPPPKAEEPKVTEKEVEEPAPTSYLKVKPAEAPLQSVTPSQLGTIPRTLESAGTHYHIPTGQVGDLHGEIQRLVSLMEAVQLSDKSTNFANMAADMGMGHLGDTGLMPDSIPQVYDLIDELITKQSIEAHKAIEKLEKDLKLHAERLRRGVLLVLKEVAKRQGGALEGDDLDAVNTSGDLNLNHEDLYNHELVETETHESPAMKPKSKPELKNRMKAEEIEGEFRVEPVRPQTVVRPETVYGRDDLDMDNTFELSTRDADYIPKVRKPVIVDRRPIPMDGMKSSSSGRKFDSNSNLKDNVNLPGTVE